MSDTQLRLTVAVDPDPEEKFPARLANAAPFEEQLVESMRLRGWTAELFGRSKFSKDVNDLLSCVDTPIRWMPDVIACKQAVDGAVRCVYLDAKKGDSWQTSENHIAEIDAVMGAYIWSVVSKCPVYIVYPDKRVYTPDQVIRICWKAPPRRFGRTGSDTPAVLVKQADGMWFADVFGERPAQ